MSHLEFIYDLPNIHILHTHDHIVVVIQKGAIKCDNIIRVTSMHNLELSNDSSSHLLLGFHVYHLETLLARNYDTAAEEGSQGR